MIVSLTALERHRQAVKVCRHWSLFLDPNILNNRLAVMEMVEEVRRIVDREILN